MPGKGASRCRACLNRTAIDREVRLTTTIFAHEWVAVLWSRFANWVYGRSPGNPKILDIVRSHQGFFERVDATFESALDLTGPALLHVFGTATLRRHLLPTQFLAEQVDIHVYSEAKSQASEFDRIKETLIAAKRTSWDEIIHAYHQVLLASALAPRSVRMYLATAAAFCAHADVGVKAWSHGVLEGYLKDKPGTKNSLSRFVSFCRKSRGWDVHMPAKGITVQPLRDPVRSAKTLRELLKKVDATGLQNAPRDVLGAILCASLGLPKSAVMGSTVDFHVTSDTVTLCLGAEKIRVPNELEPYARRFAEMTS